MPIRKNVGRRERIVRIVAGMIMMLCGIVGLQAMPLGIFVAAVGGVTMLTGIIRYCPACAIGGKQTCDS
ncbi:YgaP family membrane protein [Noviherbaspirillum galbum]